MPYIVNYGSKEQIERFIPKMAAGKCISAIAMTEPGAGRSGRLKKSACISLMWCSFSDLSALYLSSDLQGVKTYAKRDGSDWILNGSKVLSHKSENDDISASAWTPLHLSLTSPQVFITNGWMADLVVVVAVTNREAKTAAHGISLFLVEDGMKGFHKGRKLDKIGLRAQVPELAFLGF